MRVYIGFDVGTTNTKCLILNEFGKIVRVLRTATPKKEYKGELFFNLSKIEGFIDSSVSSISDEFDVTAIGFSTIGESVVPVKDGRALSDAPLWNDYSVTSTEEERLIIEASAPADIIGTASNPLFSIHKILWMRRNIEVSGDADFYLPLSSYFCYRKTGIAAWDYSQAARSSMFDVRNKCWISKLLDEFSIKLPEKILPMGSPMGSADGILYSLGGHDHIVGFFGIEKILARPDKSIYYSSMGTSEVLATIVPEERVKEISASRKSYISPSFTPSSYIATRSFRAFGSMLKTVMCITGYGNDFDGMNRDISTLRSREAACLFSQDGDFISDSLVPDKLYISELDKSSSRASLAEAAYLYLSAVSELMREDLQASFMLGCDFIFVSGGGITGNDVFMKYLAAAIGEPVVLLDTEEISALGAALTAVAAYSDAELKRICSAMEVRLIEPDETLKPLLADTLRRYMEVRR